MFITVLEVAVLLAIIIVPLKGPTKKDEKKALKIDKNVTDAHYAVNEHGYLEELHGRELSNHEH